MAHPAFVEELHLRRIEFPFRFLTCSAEARLIEIARARDRVIDVIDDYVSSLGANLDLIRNRLFFSLVAAHATGALRGYLH